MHITKYPGGEKNIFMPLQCSVFPLSLTTCIDFNLCFPDREKRGFVMYTNQKVQLYSLLWKCMLSLISWDVLLFGFVGR